LAPKQSKGTKLSVFKGREAKLNRAIFQTLSKNGPQVKYELYKQVTKLRGLKRVHFPAVSKRVNILEESGYLRKCGTRVTKNGAVGVIYEIKKSALLALVLDSVCLDDLLCNIEDESAEIISNEIQKSLSDTSLKNNHSKI
jgi:DNA-binding Lrp family transcriptional regulator